MKSHLGDRIRSARGTLTQDELADRIRRKRPEIKLSGVRISRYERGVQEPRLAILTAIAEETGKPLDFFHVESNGESAHPDDEEEEEDSDAMIRAAYHLDLSGQYTLADDLRLMARKAKFRAVATRKVLA